MKGMKHFIFLLSAVFLFSSITVPTVSAKEQAQKIPGSPLRFDVYTLMNLCIKR
ncbi:hypothetical protein [Bacillus xiapuensis]|uniref:hypothetical protein n=1 Tax=Bacillus xiapuensis TaxID=2014075 RepID=UPI0012FD3D2C|nr:hypothetical protein [Bacillus xiapuensis]